MREMGKPHVLAVRLHGNEPPPGLWRQPGAEAAAEGECALLSGRERWPASQMDSSLSGSFHFLWPFFDLPDD